jgi:hypothetical protein
MSYDNIWSFKTKNFRVDYDVTDDADLDLSWDDDGSAREGLESGKYVAFVARVSVHYKGQKLSVDYLGGCIYESPEAFMNHRGINRHEHCGSYFSDMVHSVVVQARKSMCEPRPYIRCN